MTNGTEHSITGSFLALKRKLRQVTPAKVELVLIGVTGSTYNEEPDDHCPNRPVDNCVEECVSFARNLISPGPHGLRHIETSYISKVSRYHEFRNCVVRPDLIPIGTDKTKIIWKILEHYGHDVFELFDPFPSLETMLPFVEYSYRETVPPKKVWDTREDDPQLEPEPNFDNIDDDDFRCTERRVDRKLNNGKLKEWTASFPYFVSRSEPWKSDPPMQWFCQVIVRDFAEAALVAISRILELPDSALEALEPREDQSPQLVDAPDRTATPGDLPPPEGTGGEDISATEATADSESCDETPMHPKDWKDRNLSDSMPAWEREPETKYSPKYSPKGELEPNTALERDRWLYWTFRSKRLKQWQVVLEANKHWRIGEREKGEIEESAQTKYRSDDPEKLSIGDHKKGIAENVRAAAQRYAKNYSKWAMAFIGQPKKQQAEK